MSTPPDILIYAELLSNIRQVSVGCSLQTPSNSSTKAVISPNGLRLAINHDGVEQFVQLPGQVNPILQLPIPKIGANGLTWRLPLASTTASNGRPSVEDQSIPWSASDLEPGLAIRCRACKAVIVQSDVLTVWKDLPSENWAEMMEFWHCHKPNDHDNHDEENLAQKGYGANSRISAQPGVGFVDLASFLLSESDINDSVVAPNPTTSGSDDYIEDPTQAKPSEVTTEAASEKTLASCSACSRPLGFSNSKTSSISLFKWQVSVGQEEPKGSSPSAGPSLAQCVSAILLATISRTGCSKSILIPMEMVQPKSDPELSVSDQGVEPRSLLNIWVFNGNITFSSTGELKSPRKAVKVLYRLVSQEEADKMLDSMTSDVQDITLPTDAIDGVMGILENSNSLIPDTDRYFKEWTVGLIEKWVG
ncbi:hypothetical protein MGN70_014022 [Eutypa lata]|nr:hypothetical protein MGN70_014022 [Eutypa lata]